MQPNNSSPDGSRKQVDERRKINDLADCGAVRELSEMILEEADGFIAVADRPMVKALIASFMEWVYILPASEKNHHSEDFGLLLHSAMVAFRLFGHIGANPAGLANLDNNARRDWILAGTAAALLHDCGKALDMEVRLSNSSEIWDPLEKALVDFVYDDPAELEKVLIKFIPGRGLKGHEAKGRALIPLILPPGFAGDLTTKTLAIYDACASHHMLSNPRANWPAAWFAALILTSDREDCAMDLKLRREGHLLDRFDVSGN